MTALPPVAGASGGQNKGHLGFLDGLRALAALFVVLHHFWIHHGIGIYGMGARSGLLGLGTNWLLYGHLAVDMFIVLSGFCLMLPVAQSGGLRGGTVGFCRRRCRRILPPLWAALAVFTLHGMAVQFHQEHRVVFPQIGLLLPNVLLLQDVLPRDNRIDGVAWSVAAEWKVYFLFPLFVWVWRRRGIFALPALGGLLAAAATAALHWASPQIDMAQSCPWYVFLFALGAAGASAVFGRSPQAMPASLWPWTAAVAALLAGLLARYPITDRGSLDLFDPHLPLIDPVAGLLTTLLLMLLTRQMQAGTASPALRVLSWPPLMFIGSFAYSIYLVHILFKDAAFAAAERLSAHLGAGLETPLAMLLGLPLVLCAAYLFHLAFERPFMTKSGVKIKTEAQAEAAAIVNPAP